MIKFSPLGAQTPIFVAFLLLVIGGIFLLEKAEAQARDTIRKHHLEDIEQALYLARNTHGTYPPYEQPFWCGTLSAPGNEDTTTQVEKILRQQNAKYANPAKPFPTDPLARDQQAINSLTGENRSPTYFYWKRSPSSFELFSVLEADPNGERSTNLCHNSDHLTYDYGIASVWREN